MRLYGLKLLECEQHVPNWNCFRFLSAIFISSVTATPGDVNIVAIEKVNPDNIGIAVEVCQKSQKLFVLFWRCKHKMWVIKRSGPAPTFFVHPVE